MGGQCQCADGDGDKRKSCIMHLVVEKEEKSVRGKVNAPT